MKDSDFSHPCSWPGCKQLVPWYWWGCKQHWFALPVRLRRDLWRSYRPHAKGPSPELWSAVWAAWHWISKQPQDGAKLTATRKGG